MTRSPHLLFYLTTILGCVCLPCVGRTQPMDASATRGQAALTLTVEDGVRPLCFSAQSLRDHVNAQLGYDAFMAGQDSTYNLMVMVERAPDQGLRATLTSSRPGQDRTRSRTLSSPQCNDLLDAVVFSLTLAIDPMRATSGVTTTPQEHASRLLDVAHTRALHHASITYAMRKTGAAISTGTSRAKRPFPTITKPPAVKAATTLTSPETIESTISASTDEASPAQLHVVIGGGVRGGTLPTPGAQWSVGVRRTRAWRAVELSVESMIPLRYASLGGEVTLSAHHLKVATCGEHASAWVSLCASLAAGAFRGTATGLPGARAAHGLLLAPGLSMHPMIGLSERVGLRFDVEGQWLASGASWVVGDQRIAKSNTLAWTLGTSLVFSAKP
jgi:hypothetical protein